MDCTSEIEVKKKAKSNDPGRKYEYWLDENDKNKIKCDLCGFVTNGGIKRQKEHLVGGFSDVKKCPKTTKEIAEEMLT
ncbi:hypothetical protein Taro_015676 [Colocasia esculenta]|uniref:BED-type domain-containing protein n=1 Tax=Colocasia esculenta TaxID=4460 RepID=A0A843UTX6_COLES|nr:hypothetical protein [Colocasia esculenta]